MPAIRSNYGDAVANGIQQNLGKGPYDQIKPEIICYELENNWFKWLQQNKSPETHLLGLELIVALHIYRSKPLDFDFTAYEMQKGSMGLDSRAEYLERALKGAG